MKIANLLAQYLYTNRRLDLPGIGSFKLDPAVIIDNENHKHRSLPPEGISFESNISIRQAPDLVEFISSKSGKMKVLAESDLESHLQMIQQFLNINKPFSFDGIGTLVKLRQGEFEFTPGNIISSNKLKENPEKEKQAVTNKGSVEAKYQVFLATPTVKSRWRKPVVAFLILCGIGFAVWGGYTISTNREDNIEESASVVNTTETVAVPDTAKVISADTTAIQKPVVPDTYKYVLEVRKGKRALDRYTQLKNTWLNIADTKLSNLQMETTDSVQYKLFVMITAAADTTRTMDTLTAFLGKKVYIERQN